MNYLHQAHCTNSIVLDLGDGKLSEGVFIFENLTADGFRMGPRDKLDLKHVMLMTESIAKHHAISYALKIQDREKYDELVDSLKPLPFSGEEKTMFDQFYKISLERLIKYVNSSEQTKDYTSAVQKLRDKYINKPSMLLQNCLIEDEVFDTIIHGDYNRNNVMFKYGSPEGYDDPLFVKMFDFQWVKKASPVLDISFYLLVHEFGSRSV